MPKEKLKEGTRRMKKRGQSNLLTIFLTATKLGISSFGGPTAHLAYFHEEYVRRKKWLDEKSYADLLALSQFLPGPASSQVGIGIGFIRGGFIGSILSFLGFTLPSLLLMMGFAYLMTQFSAKDFGVMNGLKLVALAIVAQAILGMMKTLAPDLPRKAIVFFVTCFVLLFQSSGMNIVAMGLAALFGFILYPNQEIQKETESFLPIRKGLSILCLSLFFALLIILPLLSSFSSSIYLTLFDRFYRAGALVFGGGHVVLPLLEQEFVQTNFISQESFLAGYSMAQAVPGPLFTFASYIGTVMKGWSGGLVASVAIFLPAFLLILGSLAFWDQLRRNPKISSALLGLNAGVVGLLLAAFFHPIWTSTMKGPLDLLVASLLFVMLNYFKLPAWLIVLSGAFIGFLRSVL